VIPLESVRSEALAALAAPLAQLHSTCFPDDPWPPQALAEIAAMAGVFGRIARDDETAEDAAVTGLALAQSLGKECEILTLGVVPARRRVGIGSALLAAVIAEAGCRGAQTLFLEVAEDNIAARALYAAHGFIQIGRRANYYRRFSGPADALVLRLLLATSVLNS
jgi:[ribosomal protein S18]-alanine N-acetyltransferase